MKFFKDNKIMNSCALTTQTSGTITVLSDQKFVIEKNSNVFASINADDYKVDNCFYIDDCKFEKCRSLFFATNKSNIELCAKKNGVISGNGAAWSSTDKFVSRPGLIKLVNCRNVYIHDLVLLDSPYWSIWLHNCDDVVIENVRIISKWGKSNTGIEIDCSRNVRITNCYIETNDDCVDVKTTKNISSFNILIENSTFISLCSAFRIGTETVGDIKKVKFINNKIKKALVYGIKIFATDGAKVSEIEVDNIEMNNVTGPFIIATGTRMKQYFPKEKGFRFSSIIDVKISNVKADVDPQGFFIKGKDGEGVNIIVGTELNYIKNVEFCDCEFKMPGGFLIKNCGFLPFEIGAQFPEFYAFGIVPASGFYVCYANNISFRNVKLSLKKEDVRDLYKSIMADNIQVID